LREAAVKRENAKKQPSLAKSTKLAKGTNNRKTVAKEANLPERGLRDAQAIKKAAPDVSALVRAGVVSHR
jgi:hypothetical protein